MWCTFKITQFHKLLYKILQEVPWLNKCRAGLCKETTGYCTSQPAEGTLRTQEVLCGGRCNVGTKFVTSNWARFWSTSWARRRRECTCHKCGHQAFNGFGIFHIASFFCLEPFFCFWKLMPLVRVNVLNAGPARVLGLDLRASNVDAFQTDEPQTKPKPPSHAIIRQFTIEVSTMGLD